MKTATQTRTTRIQLEDYDYQQDIADRLLLSELGGKEIEILDEILNSSVCFSLASLVEAVESSESLVKRTLEQFQGHQLLTLDGDKITVNKERRKAFDVLNGRFQEEFRPNLDYIQSLLRHLPIHILPSWYLLHRGCENIFDSALERLLPNPREYQRHLDDTAEANPLYGEILQKVLSQPYCVPAHEIQSHFHLSPEAYQEVVLNLEYGFIACSGFRLNHGEWTEVLTPLHEWTQYRREQLRRLGDMELSASHTPSSIRPGPFGFAQDLHALAVAGLERGEVFLEEELPNLSKRYSTQIEAALASLRILHNEQGQLTCTDRTKDWILLSPAERCQQISSCHRGRYRTAQKSHEILHTDRDLVEIGRILAFLPLDHWVPLTTVTRLLEVSLGNTEGVRLEKKGRRWDFSWPEYSDLNLQWIEQVLCEWAYEVGYVDLAQENGQQWLRLTAHGQQLLRPDGP